MPAGHARVRGKGPIARERMAVYVTRSTRMVRYDDAPTSPTATVNGGPEASSGPMCPNSW
jgi:hypothetical protein